MECPFHNVRAFFSQPLNIVRTKSPQRVCTNEYSNRKQGRYSTLTIGQLLVHNLKSGILVTNKYVSCLLYVLSAGRGCQAEEQQQYIFNDDEGH